MWTTTHVTCLAGSRANERPTSFTLHTSRIPVSSVIASWREPGYLFFTVETFEGRRFVLRCHEQNDVWQVKKLPRRNG